MDSGRVATIARKTRETDISLKMTLDGEGNFKGNTGVGFLDHMLELFARHGSFDMVIMAKGDLWVDHHHTVEDVGICLGAAIREALGDKKGINRYGNALIPMDEALVLVALDISGRPYLETQLALPSSRVGDFDTELVEEFFRAFAVNAGVTLHIRQLAGKNTHHIIEAAFKGLGRSLKMAAALTGEKGVPSTKGLL